MTIDGSKLELRDLEIRVGDRVLVAGARLSLEPGWIVGLVGASGSGKTLTARSLLGLVDLEPGVVRADLEIQDGPRVLRPYDACIGKSRAARDAAFRPIRGRLIGYLPQDPRRALDPLWSIGRQVQGAARHAGTSDDPRVWLRKAGLLDADRVAGLYPHELSGGMAQRVVIAQALACGSRFLLADEPTTALDPSVQVDVIDALRAVVTAGVGLLLITHDLRLLPELADEVAIMDAGMVVERTTPHDLRKGRVSSDPARRLLAATRRIAAGQLG